MICKFLLIIGELAFYHIKRMNYYNLCLRGLSYNCLMALGSQSVSHSVESFLLVNIL